MEDIHSILFGPIGYWHSLLRPIYSYCEEANMTDLFPTLPRPPRPRFAHVCGQIVPYAQANVGLLTHALNYGTGVFAAMRGYWNADKDELLLFRPEDHFQRFIESAQLLRMRLSRNEVELTQAAIELLRAEDYEEDCYLRALAFYGDEVIGIRLHGLTPKVSLVAVPFGRYIEKDEAAHVTISSWRRVEDNVIPPRGKVVGAYVNSALIKSDAELAGFDEAIVLNANGQVSEGSAENVFIVRRGRLVTPSTTSAILEGITRRTVIQLAEAELGLPLEERPIDRTELYLAEEMFLTGTAAQITAVTHIDHRPIGAGRLGEVTRELRRIFARVVRGEEPRYRHWCRSISRPTAAAREPVLHALARRA
jgi:branched-chain amino acid aminotransferase